MNVSIRNVLNARYVVATYYKTKATKISQGVDGISTPAFTNPQETTIGSVTKPQSAVF